MHEVTKASFVQWVTRGCIVQPESQKLKMCDTNEKGLGGIYPAPLIGQSLGCYNFRILSLSNGENL